MEGSVKITRLPKSEFYAAVAALGEKAPGFATQIPLSRLSKYASERLITDASIPIPECVTCGACCVYSPIVPMSSVESEPIDVYWDITLDDAEDVVIERVLPRDLAGDGRCSNLAGKVAVEVGCTIYDSRPHTCRDLEPGSDRCHGYRRKHGIEPVLTDPEIAAALEKLGSHVESGRIPEIEITLESTSFGFDMSAPPGRQSTENKVLKITAHMRDRTAIDLHRYDPKEEQWFEHELEGCTLEEAAAIIEQRKAG
ncbi:MAG TPA: YkgJ family cysteine cluster protein [Pyrinomonadaceae bacterium]|nr:YkgJ family cysteine cluster protein [Pyrinomonadaceae bacterium]